MRVRWVDFSAEDPSIEAPNSAGGWFKNVHASFPLAPIVVLFGRNDAGKTNTLEAFRVLFSTSLLWNREERLGVVRAGLFDELSGEEPWPFGPRVLVELEDVEVPDSDDARYLAELLQFVRPQITFGRSLPEPKDVEREGAVDFGNEPQDFDVLRSRLKQRLLRDAERQCEDWTSVVGYLETLIDACLRSRWVEIWLEDGWQATWLAPPLKAARGVERSAAVELIARRDCWKEGVIPFVHAFAESLLEDEPKEGHQARFLDLGFAGDFDPFEIIEVRASPERLGELLDQLEEDINWAMEDIHYAVTSHCELLSIDNPLPGWVADEWLEEIDGEAVCVHRLAREVTRTIEEHTNDLAPRFVRERHTVLVQPYPPAYWRRAGGRRLDVALAPKGTDREFPLSVAGAGVTVWAGYSVAEAVRRVSSDAAAAVRAFGTAVFTEKLRLVSPTLADLLDRDSGAADFLDELPRTRDEVCVRLPKQTLYLVDEPERHLHRIAEAEAAKWVADRADEAVDNGAAHVMVASHSPAFLSLRSSLAEYVLVYLDERGRSTASRLTPALKELDGLAIVAGLSRADVLQLTRAFLIVEGPTDKAVIERFYGDCLDDQRIRTLAPGGLDKNREIAEVRILAQLGLPLVLLFDETTRPTSEGSRVINAILADWPEDRKPPEICRFAPEDILELIPDDAFAAALAPRGKTWPGWDNIRRSRDAEKRRREEEKRRRGEDSPSVEMSLKKHMLSRIGLRSSEEHALVEALLQHVEASDLANSPLDHAIRCACAYASGDQPGLVLP
jgi:hypothetical protein